MNELLHTGKCNAPPYRRHLPAGRHGKAKVEGGFVGLNPDRTCSDKNVGNIGSKRQKYGVLLTECTLNLEPETLNLSERDRQLLKMRDRPRGRAPALEVSVSLIKTFSVNLCVVSVLSVVKNASADESRKREAELRREQQSIKNLAFRYYCTEDGRLQEEKANVGMTKKVYSDQSQFTERHP